MARNFLQMWNGYSSHQLVFGRNPKLPVIMTDALPALEGITSSQIFAQHLNMLHKSRSAYIQTDKERFTLKKSGPQKKFLKRVTQCTIRGKVNNDVWDQQR